MGIIRHPEYRHDCLFLYRAPDRPRYFCSDPFGEWDAKWGHRIKACPRDCKRHSIDTRDECAGAGSMPALPSPRQSPHRMQRGWAT